MRWHVKEYDVNNLQGVVAKLTRNYTEIEKTSWTTIVSLNNGVYHIENDSVYKLHYDSKFSRFFFNDTQLICQHSEPIKEEILSHIPINYQSFQNCLVKYAMGDSYTIMLCVLFCEGVSTEFYFEPVSQGAPLSLLEHINLSKKEINGFLSTLN